MAGVVARTTACNEVGGCITCNHDNDFTLLRADAEALKTINNYLDYNGAGILASDSTGLRVSMASHASCDDMADNFYVWSEDGSSIFKCHNVYSSKAGKVVTYLGLSGQAFCHQGQDTLHAYIQECLDNPECAPTTEPTTAATITSISTTTISTTTTSTTTPTTITTTRLATATATATITVAPAVAQCSVVPHSPGTITCERFQSGPYRFLKADLDALKTLNCILADGGLSGLEFDHRIGGNILKSSSADSCPAISAYVKTLGSGSESAKMGCGTKAFLNTSLLYSDACEEHGKQYMQRVLDAYFDVSSLDCGTFPHENLLTTQCKNSRSPSTNFLNQFLASRGDGSNPIKCVSFDMILDYNVMVVATDDKSYCESILKQLDIEDEVICHPLNGDLGMAIRSTVEGACLINVAHLKALSIRATTTTKLPAAATTTASTTAATTTITTTTAAATTTTSAPVGPPTTAATGTTDQVDITTSTTPKNNTVPPQQTTLSGNNTLMTTTLATDDALATTTAATTLTQDSNSSTTIEPSKKPASAGTIVGILFATIALLGLVGFATWKRKEHGIPQLNNKNGNDVDGSVPNTHHNRMYNLDKSRGNNRSDEDFGSGNYATGPIARADAAAAAAATGTIYAVPMEDDSNGGGDNAVENGNSISAGDGMYGGFMYVATTNTQNASEYATAADGGGNTGALYSVVSMSGRGSAAGGAASVYDTAVHAHAGPAARQSAEYSHLAPRNGGQQQQQQDQNNLYDLGPPQRRGQQSEA